MLDTLSYYKGAGNIPMSNHEWTRLMRSSNDIIQILNYFFLLEADSEF